MIKQKLLDLDKKQLDILKEIIQQHIPDKTVWVYGSRVTWKANEVSDIDLTVFDCTDSQIYELKETLEESDLLFTVDVMNWEEIPDSFRANIKKQYVVLQEKKKLKGWREVKFSDFVQINPQVKLHMGQEYPFVEMKDLNENQKKAYSTQIRKLKGGSRFINDDTLFARITPCLENGKICQVEGLDNEKGFGSTEFLVFRGKDKVSYSSFVYYLSRSEEVRRFAELNMTGTSGRQRVPKTAFNELVLELPPLPEQKAIAEVLSSLDDKIDLLHRQNKTLEDMAQTLFRQWFIEQADAGWEVGTLGDILSVKGGTTPSTKNPDYWNGEIHWTTPKDLSNNCPTFLMDTLRKITKKGLDRIGSGLLPAGTLLLSSRAPVGYMAFSAVPIAINQGYIAIIADKGYSNLFIYSWLKLNMSYVKSFANGSTFQEVSKTSFKSLEIVIPEEYKRKKFDDIAKPAFNKIFSNQSQINTLENLRDTLLPKLMSGEVRIKHEQVIQ